MTPVKELFNPPRGVETHRLRITELVVDLGKKQTNKTVKLLNFLIIKTLKEDCSVDGPRQNYKHS